MTRPDIAAVIPHYQREPGLLGTALRSAFAQTIADRLCVVICDDGSPSPAESEVLALHGVPRERIHVHRQPNTGAGGARNHALAKVPAGVRYVAFLDSDDAWRARHLERAVSALERGYDAYFADFTAVGHPGIGNMQRIGSLPPSANPMLDAELRLHELAVSPLAHLLSDGGGLIQTSTVVYRFDRFPDLRFREEFYNGQDYFFWIDLGERGARFVYSYEIECDNGEGINIYQGAGWGSERSLQRLRNELFVWTSVERFYALDENMRRANRRTIQRLQRNLGADLLHRLRRGKPISARLVADIVRMAPSTLWVAPAALARRLLGRAIEPSNASDGRA